MILEPIDVVSLEKMENLSRQLRADGWGDNLEVSDCGNFAGLEYLVEVNGTAPDGEYRRTKMCLNRDRWFLLTGYTATPGFTDNER